MALTLQKFRFVKTFVRNALARASEPTNVPRPVLTNTLVFIRVFHKKSSFIRFFVSDPPGVKTKITSLSDAYQDFQPGGQESLFNMWSSIEYI